MQLNKPFANDLDTRYGDPDVYMVMNKSTLLDSHLKSLAHLTEEQEATVNSLVNEIVTSCLQAKLFSEL